MHLRVQRMSAETPAGVRPSGGWPAGCTDGQTDTGPMDGTLRQPDQQQRCREGRADAPAAARTTHPAATSDTIQRDARAPRPAAPPPARQPTCYHQARELGAGKQVRPARQLARSLRRVPPRPLLVHGLARIGGTLHAAQHRAE
jgi:hypothetical protein